MILSTDQNHSFRKLLTASVLIYGGMLIYASLMPYDFMTEVNLKDLLYHNAWDHWPFNPKARISGSDLVSNLALYVPLGFLLATRCSLGRAGWVGSFLLTLFACSSLSFSIELLQGMTSSRTISASDWFLNSISSMLGAAAGVFFGKTLWAHATSWICQRWQQWPLDLLTLMFMGLLTADALTPFLPTIQLSQVWGSLKRSHFSILEGLSLHPWHWWLTTRLLVYMVLTFLLAVWNRSATRDRRWGKALLLTTLFAVSLEFVKPMIVSRSINLANIAISVLGIILAILIGPRLADRLSRRRKLDAAIVALLVYLFYLAWTPFSFVWNEDLFRQKLPAPIELLPFYHYAMGSTLNHARLFVQSVAVQGILVYLLRMRFEWFEHNRFRLALALMLVVMLGLLQEGGQMFLPTRVPSMTDIYCFMIGGALGSMLPRSRQHDAGQEYVNG